MIQNNKKWMMAGIVGTMAIVLGLIADGIAKVKKGDTRPLSTANWMKNVVKPNCSDLKKEIAAGPKTDDDWASLIEHAEILNETSFILMEDERCPDKVWADSATKILRGASEALIVAAQAKNALATEAAFKKVVSSCAACHKVHKKKKK